MSTPNTGKKIPPDPEGATRAIEDAVSYKFLTEDATGAMTGNVPTARSNGGPAQLVGQTLRDVLGWKVREDDPKGFANALTDSFDIIEFEGHTQWKQKPRTSPVYTTLDSTMLSGAQASVLKRAQDFYTQAGPVIDGLFPLDPEADADDIAAVKAVLRKQYEEIVGELATPGGPRKVRINQYFDLLMASNGHFNQGDRVRHSDPDNLGGTFGRLRDMLGLSIKDDLVNTLTEEANLSDCRFLGEGLISLAQIWLNNRRFFGLDATRPFLGTALVAVSRQLSVISESVDELRFTLDSVFIGAAERETVELRFGAVHKSMFAEDFLRWVQSFVTDEAPVYVQDGGKFGIGSSVVPFAKLLSEMTLALLNSTLDPAALLPAGFKTARVRRSIESLNQELAELVNVAEPLQRDVPVLRMPAKVRQMIAAPKLAVMPDSVLFDDGSAPKKVKILNLRQSAVDVTMTWDTNAVTVTSDSKKPSPPKLNVPAQQSVDVEIGPKNLNGVTTVMFETQPSDVDPGEIAQLILSK